MNEQQAQTILDRVQQHWKVSMSDLLNASLNELEEEMEEDPVDNYTAADVRDAILCHLEVSQWTV